MAYYAIAHEWWRPLTLIAILLAVPSCKDEVPSSAKQSDSPRKLGTSATSPSGPAQAGGDIVTLWRTTGNARGIPAEFQRKVADLLLQASGNPKTMLDAAKYTRLSRSLDEYLGQFGGAFGDPNRAVPFSYWTAWIVATAAEARLASAGDRLNADKAFAELCDEVKTKVRDKLAAAVRAQSETPDKYHANIEVLVDKVHQRLMMYRSSLMEDPLFPAFRKPVTITARKRVIQMIETDALPVYRGEQRMMRTEEERVLGKSKAYCRDLCPRIVCSLFLREVEPYLNKTECWGFMLYEANSCEGRWPVYVQFVPDQNMNNARGWKRQ